MDVCMDGCMRDSDAWHNASQIEEWDKQEVMVYTVKDLVLCRQCMCYHCLFSMYSLRICHASTKVAAPHRMAWRCVATS